MAVAVRACRSRQRAEPVHRDGMAAHPPVQPTGGRADGDGGGIRSRGGGAGQGRLAGSPSHTCHSTRLRHRARGAAAASRPRRLRSYLAVPTARPAARGGVPGCVGAGRRGIAVSATTNADKITGSWRPGTVTLAGCSTAPSLLFIYFGSPTSVASTDARPVTACLPTQRR